MRRLVLATLALGAAWLVALVVGGVAARGRVVNAVTTRLSETLGAPATVGGSELGLVRGRLAIDDLALRRDDLGHLALTIPEVRAELAPLGLALLDREVRTLSIRGLRLEISTAAVFHVRPPRRPPVRARAVEIDDATLVFEASAFVPGLGRIEIHVDHARAGATTLRTPLSWLLTLEELRARVALPGGVTVALHLHDGRLAVAGSLFGGAPVELPIELPVVRAGADAREEIGLLVGLGKDLATRVVEQRAADWLRRKLGG
jgi:hypothetical protein